MDEAPRSLEQQKLELEVRKLREDLSVWSRIAAIVIPIAVFLIGAAQTYVAWSDWVGRNRQEAFDTEMKKLESGFKAVEFATSEAKHIASADHDEARQAISYMATLLPRDAACQMLNAVLLNVRVADDLSEYATSMRTQLASAEVPPPPSCLASPRDAQDQAIIAMSEQKTVAPSPQAPMSKAQTAPPPALMPAAPPPAAMQAAPAAPPPAAAPRVAPPSPSAAAVCHAPSSHEAVAFVVYYQIVQEQDRDKASQIGFEMPAQFPSAGIDYVHAMQPSKQQANVRYYHKEQEPQARYLACLLNAAYAKVLPDRPAVQFSVMSLERQYKNLPAKRVEVWFPPLTVS